MHLTFLGATETVTGSRYLLNIHGKKILIDCGLFQGLKSLRERNWIKFPVDPATIDAVLLTHAHLDHCGYLPLFIKEGFQQTIYCTHATRDLCGIVLADSGHLQEEEAQYANKHDYSKHKPALPLYTEQDAIDAMKYFRGVDMGKKFKLFDESVVQFKRAGHIIGAASVFIQSKEGSILFSGDLGRLKDPIMKPPMLTACADYLVLESTYGDRQHPQTNPQEKMCEVINQTAARGGTIIIPAFTIGRTQTLLYYLHQLRAEQAIPSIPIFLDSPMAIKVSNLFCHYAYLTQLSARFARQICSIAQFVQTPEESKTIDQKNMPKIIISASGMLTGGRVLHHLKAFGPDDRNTILLTGYQAAGTRGARLLAGEQEIKMLGKMVPIRAQVENMTNLSAHADYEEVLTWLSHFKRPPRKVFITHGESSSALALKSKIEERFGWSCVVPSYLQEEAL